MATEVWGAIGIIAAIGAVIGLVFARAVGRNGLAASRDVLVGILGAFGGVLLRSVVPLPPLTGYTVFDGAGAAGIGAVLLLLVVYRFKRST